MKSLFLTEKFSIVIGIFSDQYFAPLICNFTSGIPENKRSNSGTAEIFRYIGKYTLRTILPTKLNRILKCAHRVNRSFN